MASHELSGAHRRDRYHPPRGHQPKEHRAGEKQRNVGSKEAVAGQLEQVNEDGAMPERAVFASFRDGSGREGGCRSSISSESFSVWTGTTLPSRSTPGYKRNGRRLAVSCGWRSDLSE